MSKDWRLVACQGLRRWISLDSVMEGYIVFWDIGRFHLAGTGREWLKGRYHRDLYRYTQLWKHFSKKHLWVSEGLGGRAVCCTLNYFSCLPSRSCIFKCMNQFWNLTMSTFARVKRRRHVYRRHACLAFPKAAGRYGSWHDYNIKRTWISCLHPPTSWGVHVSHALSVICMMKGCIGHME